MYSEKAHQKRYDMVILFDETSTSKKVENHVPKLSKETMQALRKLTNFGSFRKKS